MDQWNVLEEIQVISIYSNCSYCIHEEYFYHIINYIDILVI